jgi:RNA polymerase sigma-70 factor (ECF subfamily)
MKIGRLEANPCLGKTGGNFSHFKRSQYDVRQDVGLLWTWPSRRNRLGEDFEKFLAAIRIFIRASSNALSVWGGILQRGFTAFIAPSSSSVFAAADDEAQAFDASAHAERADLADITLFNQGQISGFNRLVLRHKDKVHSLCFRLLGRNEDALDVAQEVFVRVHRGLPKFRGQAKFSTWLHTIAVNACRNRQATSAWRERQRHQSLDTAQEWLASETRGGDLEWHAPAAGLPSASDEARQGRTNGGRPKEETGEWSSGSPELDLRRKRREALLQRALNTLPEDFREAMVLRDVEGKSYEEIAAMTGWESGTVRSRIFRAREKLRELLQRGWE